MLQRELLAIQRDRLCRRTLSQGDCADFDLAGRAQRSVTGTSGRRRVARREGLRHSFVVLVAVVDAEGVQGLDEGALRLAERHSVLRTPRPGE